VLCSVYVDGFYDGSNRKATKVFVEQFHEAHGKDTQPSLLDAEGFDTAGMLKQIIEKDHPATRADMTARIAAVKDYDGATGTTRFDDHREAQKPLFLLTIDPKGIKELPQKAKAPAG